MHSLSVVVTVATTTCLLLWSDTSLAFTVPAAAARHQLQSRTTTRWFLSSTTERAASSATTDSACDFAKQDLIFTAERLKKKYGVFLIDKTAKSDLTKVVEELEKCSRNSPFVFAPDQYLGDWTLVCTTATSNEGVDTTKLFPFFQDGGPLAQIRTSIQNAANKYIRVHQRIKSTTGSSGDNDDNRVVIDRIDHVIEYMPPEELRDVLDNLPAQISTLKINPLHVSKSELILIHKATVDSSTSSSSSSSSNNRSLFKTKLILQSMVLNVAGTSTNLDPNGKDVAGINFPFSEQLGDFFQNGEFETTYMDKDVRISRGKVGVVDQLRVFVRTDRFNTDVALEEIRAKGKSVGMGVDAQVDVDELVDPEFVGGGDNADSGERGGSDTGDLTPSA